MTTTHILNVHGATLTHDIQSTDTTTEPLLLLIGAESGAREGLVRLSELIPRRS